MDDIDYIQDEVELLDCIDFLWERLNNLHSQVSEYFSDQFSNTALITRKQNQASNNGRGWVYLDRPLNPNVRCKRSWKQI